MPKEKSMRTAIIYASVHHKNTEKLVKAIEERVPDVTLFDAKSVILKDLSKFDLIGAASGIFYGRMHKSVIQFLDNNLPEHKKGFIIYTSGAYSDNYGMDAAMIFKNMGCPIVGKFNCRGYDTFGPFKLVGGLNKDHPDADEIEAAVQFIAGITRTDLSREYLKSEEKREPDLVYG